MRPASFAATAAVAALVVSACGQQTTGPQLPERIVGPVTAAAAELAGRIDVTAGNRPAAETPVTVPDTDTTAVQGRRGNDVAVLVRVDDRWWPACIRLTDRTGGRSTATGGFCPGLGDDQVLTGGVTEAVLLTGMETAAAIDQVPGRQLRLDNAAALAADPAFTGPLWTWTVDRDAAMVQGTYVWVAADLTERAEQVCVVVADQDPSTVIPGRCPER